MVILYDKLDCINKDLKIIIKDGRHLEANIQNDHPLGLNLINLRNMLQIIRVL